MGVLEQVLKNQKKILDRLNELESQNKQSNMREVYNVEEAAQRLKVSEQTIYNMIKQDRLKCINIGSRIVIPEKYIQEFVIKKEKSNNKKFKQTELERRLKGEKKSY